MRLVEEERERLEALYDRIVKPDIDEFDAAAWAADIDRIRVGDLVCLAAAGSHRCIAAEIGYGWVTCAHEVGRFSPILSYRCPSCLAAKAEEEEEERERRRELTSPARLEVEDALSHMVSLRPDPGDDSARHMESLRAHVARFMPGDLICVPHAIRHRAVVVHVGESELSITNRRSTPVYIAHPHRTILSRDCPRCLEGKDTP